MCIDIIIDFVYLKKKIIIFYVLIDKDIFTLLQPNLAA